MARADLEEVVLELRKERLALRAELERVTKERDEYQAWAAEQPCEYGSGKEDWDEGQPCVEDDPEYLCMPCVARAAAAQGGE